MSYIPIDVSSDALDAACHSIGSLFQDVQLQPMVANYVTHPPKLERFKGTTLAMYIGSSIGNFSPEEARGMTTTNPTATDSALEAWLDEGGPLGPRYVLEVSSPGMDRPLRWPRHWVQFVGRDGGRPRRPARARLQRGRRISATQIPSVTSCSTIITTPESC